LSGGAALQPSQSSNSGTPYGYGNAGGSGTTGYGGGGGGASKAASGYIGGNGISNVIIYGVAYTFSNTYGTSIGGEVVGSNVYFAGGGASNYGAGQYYGLGGGGRGAPDSVTPGLPGTPNTGGGGGGGYYDSGAGLYTAGGSGGSGIIAIRYVANDADTPTYGFSNFTFTNAGATSGTGPTYAQTQSSYGTGWWNNTSYFNVGTSSLYTSIFPSGTTGYQVWTVPKSVAYNITIAGAQGASGAGGTGGSGLVFTKSNYNLTKNDILIICVGQVGTGMGGGGGTFVYNYTRSQLLFVAGGGGGIGIPSSDGGNANTGTSGGTGGNGGGTGGGEAGGAGGTGGNGGSGGPPGAGGGGGGYTTNGTGNILGRSFINLGTGTGGGGFGGGGGGNGGPYNPGGGGGGYSGGGGGGGPNYNPAGGGGGGSYDITNPSGPVSGTASNNGMGYVKINVV
jgi:hypothetical protein